MAAGVNSRLHKHVWIVVTSRPQQPPAPTTIITLPRLLAISHFYISWTIQEPHLHLDIFLRLFSPLIPPRKHRQDGGNHGHVRHWDPPIPGPGQLN